MMRKNRGEGVSKVIWRTFAVHRLLPSPRDTGIRYPCASSSQPLYLLTLERSFLRATRSRLRSPLGSLGRRSLRCVATGQPLHPPIRESYLSICLMRKPWFRPPARNVSNDFDRPSWINKGRCKR